ncbi:MAG TPA: hypothetical protein VGQ69_13305, partial [Gemmatimonadales bacterium]|nr:hypothetical protein [Gemmatimonadales bacterium]
MLLTPDSVALSPVGLQQFSVTAQYSNGTSAPIAVNWSATGGAISAAGLYAAGGTAGSFQVVASDPLSGKADTSSVSISLALPPGQYQVLVQRDWNSYPDKAGVGSQFYVEGGLHTQYPALPVSAFWDLVPDPIFGKVIRYNQDPALNLL